MMLPTIIATLTCMMVVSSSAGHPPEEFKVGIGLIKGQIWRLLAICFLHQGEKCSLLFAAILTLIADIFILQPADMCCMRQESHCMRLGDLFSCPWITRNTAISRRKVHL